MATIATALDRRFNRMASTVFFTNDRTDHCALVGTGSSCSCRRTRTHPPTRQPQSSSSIFKFITELRIECECVQRNVHVVCDAHHVICHVEWNLFDILIVLLSQSKDVALIFVTASTSIAQTRTARIARGWILSMGQNLFIRCR